MRHLVPALHYVSQRHWPPLITTAMLWLTIALMLFLSIARSDGRFVYALDDAYIHMAIAKNLVEHGVWGVSRFEFSSSASSLLWPVLLTVLYWIFGVNEITPLVLNVLFGTGTVWTAARILQRYGLSGSYMFLVLVAVVFLTPLPALILAGMEHVLQILVSILLVYVAARVLSKERIAWGDPESLVLLVLALAVAAVRYEGLFLISVVCLLLILRRHPAYSLALAAFAILPVMIYGLISVQHGWFVVPNPVLLKGSASDALSPASVMSRLVRSVASLKIASAPHLLSLCAAALLLYTLEVRRWRERWWESRRVMTAIFISAAIVHVAFAGIGWFFRYEAYLVALGLLVTAVMSAEYVLRTSQWSRTGISMLSRYAIILIAIGILLFPLNKRALEAIETLPKEGPYYYRLTYQMGLFLKQFDRGTSVAASDIGAISYLADVYLVDLEGLGSLDIARAIQQNEYSREVIYDLTKAKSVRIAVLSGRFVESQRHLIPREWLTVGVWTVKSDATHTQMPAHVRRLGGRAITVWFYAVEEAKEDLKARLEQFASRLPSGVESQVFAMDTTP